MNTTASDSLLEAASGPHLATDAGRGFLQGQARLERVQSILNQHTSPETTEQFNKLLLSFMWEDISPTHCQAELRRIFAANPCLRTPDLRADFDPVLAAPTDSEGERMAVKEALCGLLGLVTQKRVPGRPSLEDGIRFQGDVEERFKSRPGKYEEFLSAGFGHWREGQSVGEARAKLVELLAGEEDLLERFGAIWPEKKGEEGAVA